MTSCHILFVWRVWANTDFVIFIIMIWFLHVLWSLMIAILVMANNIKGGQKCNLSQVLGSSIALFSPFSFWGHGNRWKWMIDKIFEPGLFIFLKGSLILHTSNHLFSCILTTKKKSKSRCKRYPLHPTTLSLSSNHSTSYAGRWSTSGSRG